MTRPAGFPHEGPCPCHVCARHARARLSACPNCGKGWREPSDCALHREANRPALLAELYGG